ncbi:peptidylprolyl isomerase [Nocardioides sp. GXZ039]|uniref:peptidylprolyl isomerase n=1 Tax=Nocardioides sp. GXZ039 TaxID=3136018 RepID=UPI0030F38C0D
MAQRPLLRTGSVLAALVLLAGLAACGDQTDDGSNDGGSDSKPSSGADAGQTHAPHPENPDGAPCQYVSGGEAAKKVDPPADKAAYTGSVQVTIQTNQGDIPATLDAAAAPCTVNSFTSLASQGYYDDTPCHRLTTQGIFVLQCGDPTGSSAGGPGYSFPDELSGSETYPAGTLAMANAGPDTNGSQFFVVYEDTPLPPSYTVFGKIGDDGLKVVRDIAAKGVDSGASDGAPAETVTIDFVDVGKATDGPPASESTTDPASATCTYQPDGSQSELAPPPADPGEPDDVSVRIKSSVGKLDLSLDGAAAPCTVNSFSYLAEQGFYNGTSCHRLTTSSIFVLQCGDPDGTGRGGPGYSFADELTGKETYPAGTLAMANAGPGTNGSQFFIVYKDTKLPAKYTVFGSVSPATLKAVKDVAAAGVADGSVDGAPKTKVTFEKVTVG